MPSNHSHERLDTDAAAARREGAADERERILRIVESYARQLAHGHGATGAQILQRIVDDIQNGSLPG